MPTAALVAGVPALADEHAVLVWQTCAYAGDLDRAARTGRTLPRALTAMLEFLHYRLLPYLDAEEERIRPGGLRDEAMMGLLLADHARLRADVENLEATRSRELFLLAVATLVERLARHTDREQSWLAAPAGKAGAANNDRGWELPLLLLNDIDLEALPGDGRYALVLQRFAQMHPGETLRLRSRQDPHPLWRAQQARDPGAHAWVYERSGPGGWVARITRRPREQD